MTYRKSPDDRIRLTSLGIEEWIFFSAATALGAAGFILVFHMLAWLAGWPGPFLWFGGENRISDILAASGGALIALFLFNLIGATSFHGVVSLVRLIRRPRD